MAHYDGDVTRVNIHPRRREAVLPKYDTDERSREEHDTDERSREEQDGLR
jgi:hypothetical protein